MGLDGRADKLLGKLPGETIVNVWRCAPARKGLPRPLPGERVVSETRSGGVCVRRWGFGPEDAAGPVWRGSGGDG